MYEGNMQLTIDRYVKPQLNIEGRRRDAPLERNEREGGQKCSVEENLDLGVQHACNSI